MFVFTSYIFNGLCCVVLFEILGDHRYLNVLTHSCPTRRTSDLGPAPQAGPRTQNPAPLSAGLASPVRAAPTAEPRASSALPKPSPVHRRCRGSACAAT